jgi:hypothetical protein
VAGRADGPLRVVIIAPVLHVALRRLESSPPGTLARRVGGRVRHELWRLRHS